MSIFNDLSLKTSVKKITPKEVMMLMQRRKNIVVLDVRTQSEYDRARIKTAVLLPLDQITASIENRFPHKEMTYIVYCRSGIRSHDAAILMQRFGYSNVLDLGGILDWPYDIESTSH